jgi:hypothetical protein
MTEPSRRRALACRALLAGGLVAGTVIVPAAGASADVTPPAVHHVWQIQLENESESTTFGPTSPASYLNKTLVPEGVYLADYYATGHESLDNYLSEMSGEPGDATTFADCPIYEDFIGDASLTSGPANPGVGCVYPASVQTLPDQLMAAGERWNGFMEDMGDTPTRETTTCGQPTAGDGSTAAADPSSVVPSADDTQEATATDQYAARHNPFAYFHSLIDVPAGASRSPCQADVLPLSSLAASLSDPADYNWITPDLCDDGHDSPCKGPDITGADPGPGGLTSADAFLQAVVPEIMASPAYKQDGMIVITFDEAADSDTSSCCGEVTGTTGVQPVGGGGLTGALLISPLLTPHTSTVPYNHYSLLRSYEDLFGITTGGADGQGHLGQAATAPAFGTDVYGNSGPSPTVPELPAPALVAVPVLLAGGVVVVVRRRRAAR